MKKLLVFALCAALALALCVPAAAFTDVPADAWYAASVAYCEENGLMDGMGGGLFVPDGAVTRAQLITTLWRLAGKPFVLVDHGFTDAPYDAWYDGALRWAKYMGIANGNGDGTFAPDAPLTRAQLVTFFHRYAGSPAAAGSVQDFLDMGEIPDWAQPAARWALGAGLMQGRGEGRFAPAEGAVRAELAKVLENYAEQIGTVPALLPMADRIAPTGVAFTEDGAMLVADEYNKVVWRYEGMGCEVLAGAVSALDLDGSNVGGYADGPAAEALFAAPGAIAPFLGGWAVADPANDTVRLIYDGQVLTLNDVPFDAPCGLAADGAGNLYVSNAGSGTILLVTPSGSYTVAAEGLKGPTGLAFADGKLYIAETDADRILVLTPGGTPEVFAGAEEAQGLVDGGALTEARFSAPRGLAVGPDGTVYVSDTANAAVRCVKGGQVTTLLARPEGDDTAWTPTSPLGLALSPDGTLTVCDAFAREIIRIPLD